MERLDGNLSLVRKINTNSITKIITTYCNENELPRDVTKNLPTDYQFNTKHWQISINILRVLYLNNKKQEFII